MNHQRPEDQAAGQPASGQDSPAQSNEPSGTQSMGSIESMMMHRQSSRREDLVAISKRSRWSFDRQVLYAWVVDSKGFDAVMSVIITCNLIVMCWEADMRAACDAEDCRPKFLEAVNNLLLVLYTIEALIRLYVLRGEFHRVGNGWNVVDLLVVLGGYLDILMDQYGDQLVGKEYNFPSTQIVRIFRFAKLSRAARLLKKFPELYSILHAFVTAMMTLFWGFLMMAFGLMMISLLAVEVIHPLNKTLHHEEPWCVNAFSSMFYAFLTFFQTIVAGDSWGSCALPVITKYPGTFFIFALAYVTLQLGFTNLILSSIVESAAKAREEDLALKVNSKKKDERAQTLKLHRVAMNLDTDGSGVLSREELIGGYDTNEQLHSLLDMLHVDKEDLELLFEFMDTDGSDTLSYAEFVKCIQKAQSSDPRVQMMMVKLQVNSSFQILKQTKSMLIETQKLLAYDSALRLHTPAQAVQTTQLGAGTSFESRKEAPAAHVEPPKSLALQELDLPSEVLELQRLLAGQLKVLQQQNPLITLPSAGFHTPRGASKNGVAPRSAPNGFANGTSAVPLSNGVTPSPRELGPAKPLEGMPLTLSAANGTPNGWPPQQPARQLQQYDAVNGGPPQQPARQLQQYDAGNARLPPDDQGTTVTKLFHPGRIGMGIVWSSGLVDKVSHDGQARRQGVDVNWRIHSVDGQPFSENTMLTKVRGSVPYTLTFSLPPQGVSERILSRYTEYPMDQAIVSNQDIEVNFNLGLPSPRPELMTPGRPPPMSARGVHDYDLH
eukprot:TRINITY_DN4585_c0_g1_i1.p1 TRINITY_DN4585_c0_g1~~TRINITY_DN4585_c0_g1_i1.p1  ORF type:complete len:776 (+),score=146.06 TRINITY_DN4585_c0_g1_i1:90-2417(+)